MEEAINDVRDFVINRLTPNHRITSIESTDVTTESDWIKLIDPDDPDIHVIRYILQLKYHIPGSSDVYLMVDSNGVVCTKGKSTDPQTFFDVLFDTTSKNYQIINRTNSGTDGRILYMDGTALKTRIYNISRDENDKSTMFQFKSRSPQEQKPPFEIVSNSGVALRFNRKGQYTNRTQRIDKEPPCNFYIVRVELMKITSV